MDTDNSLSEQYFNDVYSRKDDPWEFKTSEYERKKYAVTVNALSKDNYSNAFEIGCSLGVLSEMLAAKCSKLLSVDVSDLPLEKARRRLKDLPQVTVRKMTVPQEFPEGNFDLVVLSEVGYYWAEKDFLHAQQLILAHLQPEGQLLLVHWTPFVPDYPLTGDQVHDSFMKLSGEGKALTHLLGKREDKYRLDLFEKKNYF